MMLSISKLLFPHTPRHRRQRKMRRVRLVLTIGLITCAALACALWVVYTKQPR